MVATSPTRGRRSTSATSTGRRALGLRLFTIVGAVRADVGYRLNRTGPMDPDPGSHFAFHLSIGEAY